MDGAEGLIVEVGDANLDVVVAEQLPDFDRRVRANLEADAGVAVQQPSGDQRDRGQGGRDDAHAQRAAEVSA